MSHYPSLIVSCFRKLVHWNSNYSGLYMWCFKSLPCINRTCLWDYKNGRMLRYMGVYLHGINDQILFDCTNLQICFTWGVVRILQNNSLNSWYWNYHTGRLFRLSSNASWDHCDVTSISLWWHMNLLTITVLLLALTYGFVHLACIIHSLPKGIGVWNKPTTFAIRELLLVYITLCTI